MNNFDLENPAILAFIKAHEKCDAHALALKALPDQNWPRADILNQIKSRQIAARKIPGWTEHDAIIFPPPDLMEQASSQATARYKASLVCGQTFIDLTAGSGIDSFHFATNFKNGVCVEKDNEAAKLLKHNFGTLFGSTFLKSVETCSTSLPPSLKLRRTGKSVETDKINIVNEDAEDYVQDMPDVDLVYIDPQRRDDQRKGKFSFNDCSPNILGLLPTLLNKSKQIMIKASPVLDISKACDELACVAHIHIIEWQGQCREVLYLLEKDYTAKPQITAVSIDDDGQVLKQISFTQVEEQGVTAKICDPLTYIYEPSPAFMKAGCFKLLAMRFGVGKLHPQTHLYTSDHLIEDFPGRVFVMNNILAANKKSLPVRKANLSVRNFPSDVDALKKKLGLKDGGNDYLFACTLADGKHVLLHCQKV